MNCETLKNTNDLTILLAYKQRKKNGTLDLDEHLKGQETKWRNEVEYHLLEHWLTCDCEELRISSLETLAISKKSTLTFTEQEIGLIKASVKNNLGERGEYVPLIKKILKRLNDSYAVLKRQLEKEIKLKELQKVHPDLVIPTDELNAQALAPCYQEFVSFLHNICLDNIYPEAVNVRKKASLQILSLMDEFLGKDLKDGLWSQDQFRKLFECLLLDTYELNKEMAFKLIKSYNLVESYMDKQKLVELVDVAIQLGNSIRPLDSITAAYMLKISMLSSNIEEILYNKINLENNSCTQEKVAFYMVTLLKENLEKPVKLATENIVIASSKHSLYGYVFCIHSILSTINLKSKVNEECWRNVLADVINMCFDLNKAVSQIVNNSSPEGHLPMDLNPRHLDGMIECMDEVVITPQMVLLCSWRTVKEISLLFGHLTSNATIFNEKAGTGLLSEAQIKEIGNQLVTLLCETKHRGAFEQAHVGFGQLCSRLWHLDKGEAYLKELPKMWLQQLLLAVIGFTSENSKLCATRRSAGVPFMVQALVTSQIKKKCDLQALVFHSVMRILLKLVNVGNDFDLNEVENILFSETLFNGHRKPQLFNGLEKLEETSKLNEITEIKSHALNILRALYRHCLLGDLVKDYIAEGFIVAFKCYDGESWAERNAATLLLSALVVRVFGVQRTKDHVNLTLHNRMTGKKFFEKFPTLLPFLLNELEIFINDPEKQIKPKIQSILLILSRLYPSVSSDDSDEEAKKGRSDEGWKIDEFIDLVSKCGKSKVYKTRELAARALVPLLTDDNILSIASNLIDSMTTNEIPLNLLHGYSLQLLEIVRCPEFQNVQLSTEQIRTFINFLTKNVLHNLESTNCGPACFPVASVTLEIVIQFSLMEKYCRFYEQDWILNLIDKVQLHLTDNKILKRRPEIQRYEHTAVNLMVIAINNFYYKGPLLVNEYMAAQFWESVLKHTNTDVLTTCWTKLMIIIKKTRSPMLYDLAFMTAVRSLDKLVEDPDLQDSIYAFLYSVVQRMHETYDYMQYTFSKEEEKKYMCMHIFNKLSSQLKMETFYPRGEFFKLFGKTFGLLLEYYKDTEISTESKMIIYDAFLSQSSMESNFDCRLGVSEVLFDLYLDISKKDDIYYILNWWTTVLNLLYDDNAEIRRNAAEMACRLPPESRLMSHVIMTDTFFGKFTSVVGQNLEALVAAFFVWSITSAAVVLEEMDETDVFNKSCNYETFEPVQITNYCVKYLNTVISRDNLPTTLSKPIKAWLQKQLNLDYEFDTLSELIVKYKSQIPSTEKPLKRILDPTYPAKLVKEIAYNELKNVLMRENGLAPSN
ncbi:hypothetical protein TSAR_015763 [Trichomalopsis sarcophagae]|uniref:tRNA (32-2'-O)-methyltransferase regulator THADA n=1 Tax=Trichomalopsis sarcophagae TaxID=543379 RepID=A0A232EMQ6_9HYME|nr:hypothetical protein TSAR_015763 [Trichomalopsis sarcophagae]